MKRIYFATVLLVVNSSTTLGYGSTKSVKDHASQIDWNLQAFLTQKITKSEEGSSIALSADGNILAVGAPYFNHYADAGATQIYVRSGSVWKYQATLTQSEAGSKEGSSVALAAEGNMLAVIAPPF